MSVALATVDDVETIVARTLATITEPTLRTLTVAEAAAETGLPATALRAAIRAGELRPVPAHRGTTRVAFEELRRWISGGTRSAGG